MWSNKVVNKISEIQDYANKNTRIYKQLFIYLKVEKKPKERRF